MGEHQQNKIQSINVFEKKSSIQKTYIYPILSDRDQFGTAALQLYHIFTLTKKVPSYLFAHFGRFCKCRVQKSTINSSIVVYN